MSSRVNFGYFFIQVYGGTSVTAVDHLCLGIPRGECFGLLGINGKRNLKSNCDILASYGVLFLFLFPVDFELSKHELVEVRRIARSFELGTEKA